MKRSTVEHLNCSIARSVEILGEWWTLVIVRDLFFGVRRFDDLVADLKISRGVLTDRLSTLVAHGVVERHQYQERPDRFEYRLTEKGRDLFPVLIALMRWGDTWLSGEFGGPPLVVTHTECGHDIAGPILCPGCHQPVGPGDLTASEGPGAHGGAPVRPPG